VHSRTVCFMQTRECGAAHRLIVGRRQGVATSPLRTNDAAIPRFTITRAASARDPGFGCRLIHICQRSQTEPTGDLRRHRLGPLAHVFFVWVGRAHEPLSEPGRLDAGRFIRAAAVSGKKSAPTSPPAPCVFMRSGLCAHRRRLSRQCMSRRFCLRLLRRVRVSLTKLCQVLVAPLRPIRDKDRPFRPRSESPPSVLSSATARGQHFALRSASACAGSPKRRRPSYASCKCGTRGPSSAPPMIVDGEGTEEEGNLRVTPSANA